MAVARSEPLPVVGLRPASPRDADRLRAWRSEATVRRHQPLNDLSAAQIRNELANLRIGDLYRGRGEKFQWVIEVDSRPAGWITLVVSNWEHGLAEVGYALATAFQGRGIMVQALELLLDDLFSGTLLERIEARCAVENTGSQHVLEKVGFTREGRLRAYFRLGGRRVDNYVYSLLRSDRMGRG